MGKPRSNQQRSAGKAPLPRWKKLAYGLLTMLLFFAGLELVLALCGFEPLTMQRDPYAGFTSLLPHFEERAEIGEPPMMRTARNKLAYLNDQRFAVEKPLGTFRIFCLGGSTTQGQPYGDTTSFVGWLRTLLEVAYPDREWEVVNAGGISYASYRVAALMEELVEYEPDLFIIYTGHNEFLEERTYRKVRATSRPHRWLTIAAAKTRTGAVFHELFSSAPADDTAVALPHDVETILDRTVGPTSYERDDALRRQIVAHYGASLRRMIELAESAGARVVFVRPACNLRDCSPFKSEPSADLADEPLEWWRKQMAAARRQHAEGHHEKAVLALREAARVDDRAAELHYLLGRSLFALDKWEHAEAAFWQAVDEDICPLRMTTDLGRAFDRAVVEEGVPVVEFPKLLREELLRREGHPLLGHEQFLDHVHPAIEAHGLLAVALLERLRREDILPGRDSIPQHVMDTASERIEAQVDPVTHARAEAELARVLFWAGKRDEAGPLALKALPHDADDPRTWLIAGVYLHDIGRTEEALEYLRQAQQMSPNDPRIQWALREIAAPATEPSAAE